MWLTGKIAAIVLRKHTSLLRTSQTSPDSRDPVLGSIDLLPLQSALAGQIRDMRRAQREVQ